ncbi:MAG: putative addiction module antidote protein [Arenimonas sp.]|nr:putative addiction module antidote protein [Arenimonas sp.]MBP7917403.1 putative addiction module antidote protein [Arenimonas sp.]
MKRKIPIKLTEFDIVDYLDSDEAIAEFINAAIDDDDPDFLLIALKAVARARGMGNIAALSGLGRESLYKALSPGAKPRFDTIMKVMQALGLRLKAEAA